MKLYITGGGTGGHVTPGLAIAKYCQQKKPDTIVRFAGTSGGIESKLVPREGYPLDIVEISGLRRSFKPDAIIHNLKTVKQTFKAQAHAKDLLLEHKPDCVIGCGGYVSFPVVSAAQKLGIPTILLEVNAFPGLTTKILAKKADRILVCFEQACKILGNSEKIHITGAPVRTEIVFADRKDARKKLGLNEDDKFVVSFWGSMGAKYMNEHMADMIMREIRENVSFYHIHATGSAASKWVPKLIRERGVNPDANENTKIIEYIYDMAEKMAAADLILCRAGAATIGEICALGRASIIVPSPYVAENHQEKNARALEKSDACKVLLESEANGNRMFEMVVKLLENDEEREQMARNAAKFATLDASEKIYQHILQLIKKS